MTASGRSRRSDARDEVRFSSGSGKIVAFERTDAEGISVRVAPSLSRGVRMLWLADD
jgi:hypothetical protein